MKAKILAPNHLEISINGKGTAFQSYDSIIAMKTPDGLQFSDHWDYSSTTMRHLGKWLGENAKEIRAKFKSGEYKVTMDVDGVAI